MKSNESEMFAIQLVSTTNSSSHRQLIRMPSGTIVCSGHWNANGKIFVLFHYLLYDVDDMTNFVHNNEAICLRSNGWNIRCAQTTHFSNALWFSSPAEIVRSFEIGINNNGNDSEIMEIDTNESRNEIILDMFYLINRNVKKEKKTFLIYSLAFD